MFIKRIKKNYKPLFPIFTEDILRLFPEFTRAYVFRLLKQAQDNGDIIKFSRGVYCIPKETFFGHSTLTSSMVAAHKYIGNAESIYGIYSGISLLNQFGITKQVPNIIEIITNNEATRKRVVDIGGMKFVIKKSRFEINKDNCDYYALLQLFLQLGSNPKLNDLFKRRVEDFVTNKNIDKKELIKLAMKFPAQTLKNLIESGVAYGII